MSQKPVRSARRASPPRIWLARASLALMAGVPYVGALANDLVWDDRLLVVGNPRTAGLWAALAQFWAPEGIYYRPLVFLTFGIENDLGASAWLFHLTNVALHAANTVLLFETASATGVGWAASLAASGLFAVHPLQTEAVAYVSGRTDLLMTAAALLAVRLLVGARFGPAPLRGVSVAFATAAAILSKETGYVLALLLPWLARRHCSTRTEALWLAAPSVVVALVLLWLRPVALPLAFARGLVEVLAGAGATALEYARLLVWPSDLQVDRLVPAATSAAQRLGLAGVALGLGATAAFGLARRGAVGDWAAWASAMYLPASNLFPIYPALAQAAFFVPEHNLYAPLAGIAVLASVAVEHIQLRLPQAWLRVSLALAASALAVCAVRTGIRVQDWRDEETLFSRAADAGALSSRVWFNLGNARMRALESRGLAVLAYREAVRLSPNDADLWNNLGAALQAQGSLDDSHDAYARALDLAPSAATWENLGLLEFRRGNAAGARAAFEQALSLDPERPRAKQALQALAVEGR